MEAYNIWCRRGNPTQQVGFMESEVLAGQCLPGIAFGTQAEPGRISRLMVTVAAEAPGSVTRAWRDWWELGPQLSSGRERVAALCGGNLAALSGLGLCVAVAGWIREALST